MAEPTQEIPALLVERFAKSMAAFVQSLAEALDQAAQRPELASAPAFRVWKGKAFPLLLKQNTSIQAAAQTFAQGDPRSIVALAEDKRGLAKDLDGFPLTFAGEGRVQELEALETAVVLAAYQLCAAAGMP